MITQGKWYLNDNDGIIYTGMKEICSIPSDEDEDMDNAALITAAPKLLGLAEQYKGEVEQHIEVLENQSNMGVSERGEEIAHWTATLKTIEAVIKAAKKNL